MFQNAEEKSVVKNYHYEHFLPRSLKNLYVMCLLIKLMDKNVFRIFSIASGFSFGHVLTVAADRIASF